jgi:hypothetical protein
MDAQVRSSEVVEQYRSKGFSIATGVVPRSTLDRYSSALCGFLDLQQRKLVGRKAETTGAPLSLDAAIDELAAVDWQAVQEACKMARNSPAGLAMAADPAVQSFASRLLEAPVETLVFSGPSLFVNRPREKHALYTWHAEYHWYPKRRNFVNLWLPIVHAKRPGRGTMAVLEKSHERHWAFSEFYGFDKESEGDAQFLLQYEIPNDEVRDLTRVDIEADPGDVVAFHPRCVHTSTVNESDHPTYAATIRVFDYRRDLTVSADWAERPYRIAEKSSVGGRSQFRSID